MDVVNLRFLIVVLILDVVGASRPVCPNKCGNLNITYPFGVGQGCYKNKWFEITCQHQVPMLNAYQLKILNISGSEIRVAYHWNFSHCYPLKPGIESRMEQVIKPVNKDKNFYNPFTFSNFNNKLVAVGCDVYSYIRNPYDFNYTTGCLSLCHSQNPLQQPSSSACTGVLCCQTALPVGLKIFHVAIASVTSSERSSHRTKNSCARAFLAEQSFTNFSSVLNEVPVRVTWYVGNGSCEANKNRSDYACRENSKCVDHSHSHGYRCNCIQGYSGNPYLHNGCKDIDECAMQIANCSKQAPCKNTAGAYYCSCPKGYHGDGTQDNGCIPDKQQLSQALIVSLGVAAGLTLAVIVMSGILCSWRLGRQRQLKLRQMFFKRNGGLLLQQQIASRKGAVGTAKIFGIEELERATDNFSAGRIRGTGGFCSVYKGMLSDGKIVAIKKARIMDETQVDQFINEVVILSLINHRNIVKLVGCCLETEIPLLVYEFVHNNTLFHHLHDKGHASSLSWNCRFRIALDIAYALAYLHSAATTSIFHRDVKSTNILLDENYNAIVADFGLSRSIPIEKSHLTTKVHGTFGYLDPEYFQSNQFTQKSDVYSYGVVLVELLTGEKAVSSTKFEEEKSLVINFISAVKEKRLLDMLEARVCDEAKEEEVLRFAEIARKCLKLIGKKRPTMKEVVFELENISSKKIHWKLFATGLASQGP